MIRAACRRAATREARGLRARRVRAGPVRVAMLREGRALREAIAGMLRVEVRAVREAIAEMLRAEVRAVRVPAATGREVREALRCSGPASGPWVRRSAVTAVRCVRAAAPADREAPAWAGRPVHPRRSPPTS